MQLLKENLTASLMTCYRAGLLGGWVAPDYQRQYGKRKSLDESCNLIRNFICITHSSDGVPPGGPACRRRGAEDPNEQMCLFLIWIEPDYLHRRPGHDINTQPGEGNQSQQTGITSQNHHKVSAEASELPPLPPPLPLTSFSWSLCHHPMCLGGKKKTPK